MAVDFSNLLNTKVDDIKAPPVLPEGTYKGLITKYDLRESAQKKTPGVQFHVQLREAGKDVDKEAFEALGPVDLSKKTVYVDYWLTEESLIRVKQMLQSLGISTTGRTLGAAFEDTRMLECLVSIEKEMDREDPTIVRNRARKIMGIEE